MHMPIAGDIRRHVYNRRPEPPEVTSERFELTSGERWELPRVAALNPSLSDEERLLDADALLAKSDLELEALGLRNAAASSSFAACWRRRTMRKRCGGGCGSAWPEYVGDVRDAAGVRGADVAGRGAGDRAAVRAARERRSGNVSRRG